jgi:hypothetical protein
LVKQQIDQGNWFMLPASQFGGPAIYLIALKTPVKLRLAKNGPIIPPVIQPTPPNLTGPVDMIAKRIVQSGQLMCSPLKLTLNSPDGGPWTFVSGKITSTHVEYDPGTDTWVPSGGSHTFVLEAPHWMQLLVGTWTLFVSAPDQEFRAVITATLERGTTQVNVSHTVLCHLIPPPPPPGPELDGPVQILGTRTPPARILICSNVDLDVEMPQGYNWTFVEAKRTLQIYAFDPVKQMFVNTGATMEDPVSSGDWQALLAGTYDINPGVFTGPYLATFSVTFAYGPYRSTVSHTLACGGEDFLEQFNPVYVAQ